MPRLEKRCRCGDYPAYEYSFVTVVKMIEGQPRSSRTLIVCPACAEKVNDAVFNATNRLIP